MLSFLQTAVIYIVPFILVLTLVVFRSSDTWVYYESSKK